MLCRNNENNSVYAAPKETSSQFSGMLCSPQFIMVEIILDRKNGAWQKRAREIFFGAFFGDTLDRFMTVYVRVKTYRQGICAFEFILTSR